MAARARRSGSRTIGVALAAVVVGAATALATPAVPARAAAPVGAASCGMVVRSDHTLRSNLRCSGTAITVRLDDPGQVVTLDLGRHAVVGDGTGAGVYVDARAGSGAVVVRNGRIRGFDAAVDGIGVLDVTLRDLTLRDNAAWLGSTHAEVLALTVERSRIVDSGVSGAWTESTTTVRRSHFVRSGIASPAQTYTYVYDSVFVGGGVTTGLAANVVAERNRFRHCDVGLDVRDSWPESPTVVRDNVFTWCRVGMELQTLAAGSGANGVTVARNHFVHNTEAGLVFAVHDAFGEVHVVGNRAVGNGGTGIQGTGAGDVVTVGANTALRNGGHGIDVTDVVDGGGNVARANATPPQCVGVACAAHR